MPINKDILYSDLFKKTNDIDLLQKSGWIPTSESILSQEHLELNFCGIQLDLFNVANPIVLFSTGSYSPIHFGHINAFMLSIEEAHKQGFNVVKFVISPSHDSYSCHKSKANNKWNIYLRLKEIERVFDRKHLYGSTGLE